ncbi:Alpha/Beta hydrolase protein [Mycena amicta]|nr:Alpha/Beta hydrolase protein [Mycena amicta]
MSSTTDYSIQTAESTILDVHTSWPAANTKHTPTLLFVHFWGGSWRTFDKLAALLAPSYPLVIPSLRGWGKSMGPADGSRYRILDHAEDIEALVAAPVLRNAGFFQDGLVLVGHSMGGKIAQLLAVRGNLRVKSLVLIGPAPLGKLELPLEMREQQKTAYATKESAAMVMQHVLLAPGSAVGEDTIGRLVDDCLAGSEGAKKAWPEYGMQEDYRDLLERLELPVQVVVGALDIVEPRERVKEEVVRVLENAGAVVSLTVLDGVGHLIPVEAPEQLANIFQVYE